MKVRSAITGLMGIAACLLISVQLDAQETKKTTEARSNMTAYLGIAVEPLQPVLAKQPAGAARSRGRRRSSGQGIACGQGGRQGL